jgi:hypothetical protein
VDESSLDGIRLKLKRAHKHLAKLDAKVRPWIEDVPHDFRSEIDAEAGEYAAYVVINKTPPLGWSIIVGDFVHNVRSALDQFAYLLVPGAGRHTAFPLYDDREDFDCAVRLAAKRRRRGPLTGLDPDSRAFALIELAQPYRGEHGAKYHPLHTLRELSNEDKHRTILGSAVGIVTRDGEAKLSIDCGDIEYTNFWIVTDRPMEHDAQVMGADVKITGDNPHMSVEVDLPVSVAFGKQAVVVSGLAQILNTAVAFIDGAAKLL